MDVVAGLTVTLVGIPQCLAYALMSGLPPAYGLTTAAVPGLVAALVGRSAQVVTGPTNTTGLLILAALTPYLGDNGLLVESGLPMLATLTLMAGVLRISIALVGGAAVLRFLPESVLAGFTAGAGVLIAAMQLDEALGLAPLRGAGLLDEVTGVVAALRHGPGPQAPAVLVALGCALAIALGKRFLPRWPTALLAVVGAAALGLLTGLDGASGLPLVLDRSAIPSGWPAMAMPVMDPTLIRSFAAPATAIVLLGTLELTVSARAQGARPDMAREIQAQGWANVAGAFTAAFPASASLTRSALLRLGGAQSRAAAAFAAIFVVPILLFAGQLIGYIPQATLAGVLLVTAYGMVDTPRLRRMWRAAPETRFLLVLTFVATLTLPLEWAVLLGAGLGIAIHLAQGSRPRITVLTPGGPSGLTPVPEGERPSEVVVQVSGHLHFAAVPHFVDQVEASLPPDALRVVVDLSHAHLLRYAALTCLEQLASNLHADGARMGLAGVDERFANLLEGTRCGLYATPSDPQPLASALRCLELLADERGGGP